MDGARLFLRGSPESGAFLLVLTVPVYGGLAQLARALAWHARGHRFDPDILHLLFYRVRVL